MRRRSLNARLAMDLAASDEVEVVLAEIAHPELEAPILLSTDNAVRFSIEPLVQGTRSRWRSPNNKPRDFLFVLMGALLPSDEDDTPATGTLVIELLDNEILDAIRSTTTPATVSLAWTLSSQPDSVDWEWIGFEMVDAPFNASEVRIRFTQPAIDGEAYPADRMTKQRFPGLHP